MATGKFGVGVIGCGTVGGGVVKLLVDEADNLRRKTGVAVELRKAVDIDPAKRKATGLPAELLAEDARAVLDDPEIRVVVEVIGGVKAACSLVEAALAVGKMKTRSTGSPSAQASMLRSRAVTWRAAMCCLSPRVAAKSAHRPQSSRWMRPSEASRRAAPAGAEGLCSNARASPMHAESSSTAPRHSNRCACLATRRPPGSCVCPRSPLRV